MATMIDLARFAGERRVRNLSGKERGMAARADLRLDDLDKGPDQITVLVPDFLDTISPSFFQGMFSESIRALKGKDAFLRKYKFKGSEGIMQWIDIGIRNATSDRSKLL